MQVSCLMSCFLCLAFLRSHSSYFKEILLMYMCMCVSSANAHISYVFEQGGAMEEVAQRMDMGTIGDV